MRIAMWSGPRNLSTALMYSFGNRADMTAVDEPFYAAYLAKTGLEHPMRDAVLAGQAVDGDLAKKALFGSVPTQHQYQKHMTQHMVEGIPLDWLDDVTNVFLIRHPARVLASWTHKHAAVSLRDIGFAQQLMILKQVEALGHAPIVIDSADIRARPEAMLKALCAAIGLPWDAAMLRWPAGPKPFDGVWAAHWYDAVHRSTGFAGPEGDVPVLPKHLQPILEEALPIYDDLAALKLDV